MACIKIKKINAEGDYNEETTVEVMGIENDANSVVKEVLEILREKESIPETGELDSGDEDARLTATLRSNENFEHSCNFRIIVNESITPELLRTAVERRSVDKVVSPYDEIDIPLDTGDIVTVVCAYSSSDTARFIFKDCWDKEMMNEDVTNEGGYYASKGRKHVMEDIYPRLPQEWRNIMKPRRMLEEIGDERIGYADPMWIPSATDILGTPEQCWWKDFDDGFQLPIFKKKRERVKECGDSGTFPYWLRSAHATGTGHFCRVYSDGCAGSDYASYSYGFAPGFDI